MRDLRDGSGSSPEDQAWRGQHLDLLGRGEGALTAFRAAVARDPDNADLLRHLASCQLRLGKDLRGAWQTIERAVQLQPRDMRLHVLKSAVQSELGWPQAALHSAREAIRLQPDAAEGHAAEAQALAAAKRWGEAEQSARSALAVDPEEATAAAVLSGALFAQGKLSESRSHAARMLALGPEEPEAHRAAGLAALLELDGDRAETHFREALRLDPLSRPAREGLAEAHRLRSWLFRLWWRRRVGAAREMAGTSMGRVPWIGLAILAALLLGWVTSAWHEVLVGTLALTGLRLVWGHTGRPLASFCLLSRRSLRHLLDHSQRCEAGLVGGSVALGCALAGVGLTFSQWALVPLGAACLAVSVPLAIWFRAESARGRRCFGSLAAVGLLGVAGVGVGALGFVRGFLEFGLLLAGMAWLLSLVWDALGVTRASE